MSAILAVAKNRLFNLRRDRAAFVLGELCEAIDIDAGAAQEITSRQAPKHLREPEMLVESILSKKT